MIEQNIGLTQVELVPEDFAVASILLAEAFFDNLLT